MDLEGTALGGIVVGGTVLEVAVVGGNVVGGAKVGGAVVEGTEVGSPSDDRRYIGLAVDIDTSPLSAVAPPGLAPPPLSPLRPLALLPPARNVVSCLPPFCCV